jgi:hypothetical protein
MDQAELQGWWLNLPAALSRAETLGGNLQALKLGNVYNRFEASPGQSQAAQLRGLSCGEAGAWTSWLQMMERASCSEATIVHLLEDDTEITELDFNEETGEMDIADLAIEDESFEQDDVDTDDPATEESIVDQPADSIVDETVVDDVPVDEADAPEEEG